MKNYTTMKNYLIVVLAVLGLTACKESKVEPQVDKLKLNVSEVSISVSETFQLSANLNATWKILKHKFV
jgi:hypothetical protein